MAINKQIQQYKNRVKGAVERDLLLDVNFQNAELFKRNIYQNQINQGLSYNQYQSGIKRKINDAITGMSFDQQRGFIGSSAIKQQIKLQQDAGTAISGTANSFYQSQLEASNQLSKANASQKQLEEQYTEQEALKMYEEDIANVSAQEKSTRQKYNAIFGSIAAAGTLLSLIPVTAPIGLLFDAIGGLGMVGTGIAQVAENPSGGNIAQLGLDIGFAGLSLIPGISAVRAANKTSFIAGSEGIKVTKNFAKNFKDINTSKNLKDAFRAAKKSGLPKNEAEKIMSDIAKGVGKTVEEVSKDINNPNIFMKFQNATYDWFKKGGTYNKSLKNRDVWKNKVVKDNIISPTKALKYGAWRLTKSAGKGLVVGGARTISGNILNSYLGKSKEISTTQALWEQTFDELGIPQYMRPKGL